MLNFERLLKLKIIGLAVAVATGILKLSLNISDNISNRSWVKKLLRSINQTLARIGKNSGNGSGQVLLFILERGAS